MSEEEAIRICNRMREDYLQTVATCNLKQYRLNIKALETVLNLLGEKNSKIHRYKSLAEALKQEAFKQDDVRRVEELIRYFEEEVEE